MEEVLYVKKVQLSEPVSPENVPHLMDVHSAVQIDINNDNWDWSDRNPVVTARLLHDGANIYIHYHVVDNELRAVSDSDNGPVWEDSCCEFFVSPDGNNFYYNFECNCIGTLLLHSGTPSNRVSAPAEIYDSVKRWSSLGREPFDSVERECTWDLVEVIPVTAFYKHSVPNLSGKEMLCNFYKCGDKLPHPHFLSWGPITLHSPMFHCPQLFKKIRFE